jgi:hypothetical protein
MYNFETAARHIRELARTEAYHRGHAMRYEDVARHVLTLSPRFIAEQCEAAGLPVWTSCPDEATRSTQEET